MRKATGKATKKEWMAKSVACALCAALLLTTAATASAAGGHTIAQVRESAPDYWDTGIVKNGEAVLAPVYVPDVEAVPVLRVRKAMFSDEQLAAVFGDAVDGNDDYRFYVRHYESPECIASGKGSNAYAQAVVEDMWQKTWKPSFARIFTDRHVWEDGVEPSLENTYAEGQTVSLAEVIEAMNAKLELLYGEDSILYTRATIRSGLYRYRGNGNYVDEVYPAGDYTGVGEYHLSGMQKLHGIPMFEPIRLAYQGLMATKETDLTRHVLWPQDIYFMYIDERNYFVGGYVIEEAEMLAQDVPLCTAQEAIDALAPLIEQGRIINVYNLKLGYAVGADPELTYPSGKKRRLERSGLARGADVDLRVQLREGPEPRVPGQQERRPRRVRSARSGLSPFVADGQRPDGRVPRHDAHGRGARVRSGAGDVGRREMTEEERK